MIRQFLEALAESVPLVPANNGLYQPDHGGCEKDEQAAQFPGAQDAGSIGGGKRIDVVVDFGFGESKRRMVVWGAGPGAEILAIQFANEARRLVLAGAGAGGGFSAWRSNVRHGAYWSPMALE